MKLIKLKSPAKINLVLKIKNKKNNGYHNIETIMQTINLFDKITIKKSKSFKCICNIKSLSNSNSNLAAKAAIEFFRQTHCNQQVKIKIKKKIPTQAGLGGGSSNAATTILGLNKLLKTNLSNEQLCSIAKKIGSDVSFFIFGKTAIASKTGEKIKPLRPIPKCNILIIKPKNLNISTKQAFSKHDFYCYENKNFENHQSVEKIASKLEKCEKISEVCNKFFNQFETSLKLKTIENIELKLKKLGAICAIMTGSGSSVFAIFEDFKTAKKAAKLFSKKQFFKFLGKPYYRRHSNTT